MSNHDKYVEFVNQMFDAAKENMGYKTDQELADRISEHKVDISKYRKGSRVISDWKLLRIVKLANVNRLEAFKTILLYKSVKEEVKEALQDIIDLLARDAKK